MKFSNVLILILALAIVTDGAIAKGSGGSRSSSSSSRSSSSSSRSSSSSKSSSSTKSTPKSTSSSSKYSPSKPSTPKYSKAAQRKINNQRVEIKNLRSKLDRQKMETRSARQDAHYSRYYGGYGSYPGYYTHSFHDPINMWFWIWLMSSNNHNTQAQWVHNHQGELDAERLKQLRLENSILAAKLDSMNAHGVPIDPTYVPDSMDFDLMYDSAYVDSIYRDKQDEEGTSGWTIFFIIVGSGLVIWAIWCFIDYRRMYR